MKNYLSELSRNSELLEVEVQVDPLYELAAITKAAQKKGDEALPGAEDLAAAPARRGDGRY